MKHKSTPEADLPTDEQFIQIGVKIKVQCSDAEAGWRPGWFTATVTQYCDETDTLVITYSAEPGRFHTTHIKQNYIF